MAVTALAVCGARARRDAIVAALGLAMLAGCSASSGSDRRGASGAGQGGGAAGSAGAAGSGGAAGFAGFGGSAGAAGSAGSAGAAGFGGSAGAAGSGGSAGADAGGLSGTCGEPLAMPPAPAETCGNGLDDNHNGFVDELCVCTSGQTQACFGGRPELVSTGNCTMGTQACTGGAEFAGWGPCTGWDCGAATPPPEACDTGLDEDCDGAIDEGCQLDVPVSIMGDCVKAACPPQAPHPSGCDLTMEGDDSRGCVSVVPGSAEVYFQEGDACPLFGIGTGAGNIVGTLLCGATPPDGGLSEQNCSINKAEKFFVSGCKSCPGAVCPFVN